MKTLIVLALLGTALAYSGEHLQSKSLDIQFKGGECNNGAGTEVPCPVFSMEAILDGKATGKGIIWAYEGLYEVDSSKNVIMVPNASVPWAVQSLPKDWQVSETAFVAPSGQGDGKGSKVVFSGSLSGICPPQVCPNASATTLVFDHVLMDSGTWNTNAGGSAVTVGSADFKFSWQITGWPWCNSIYAPCTAGAYLKMRFKLTGNIDDASAELLKSPDRLVIKSNVNQAVFALVPKATSGGAAMNVDFQLEDHIKDGSYVFFDIYLPRPDGTSQNVLYYDPVASLESFDGAAQLYISAFMMFLVVFVAFL